MRKNRRKNIMTQVKIVSSSDGKQMFENALNDCLQELSGYDSMELIDIKYQVSWISNENDSDDIQYSAMILYKIDSKEVLEAEPEDDIDDDDEGVSLQAINSPSYNAYEDDYDYDEDGYDDEEEDEEDDEDEEY